MLKYPKHFGSNWIWIAFAPLLLGFLMAGCVAVPIPVASESPLFGNRVEEKEVASVAAVGQSREEVISNLGKPTIELKDLRILVYPWIEHEYDWLFIGAGFAAITPMTQDWALLVAFDDKDRVTHAGLVKQIVKIFSRESINTTARNWADAQGINTPLLPTTFALSSAPIDKSLLYVFRTKRKSLFGGAAWPWPVALAVDGQYISEMHNETYIALKVEPGKHELLSDALPSYHYVERGSFVIPSASRRPASIILNTLPNQVYFIELLCPSGTGKGIESSLAQKTEADALPVIKDFRPAW